MRLLLSPKLIQYFCLQKFLSVKASAKNQSTMVMSTDLRSYDYETIDLYFSSIDYKTQFQSVQITLNLTG